jgi:hypothetical protein
MKRRLVQILVLLVAGAIVNVAVAWGFAICFDIYPQDYKWVEDLGFTYVRHVATPEITKWEVGFPSRSLYCQWQGHEEIGWHAIQVPTPLPDRYAFKGDLASLPIGVLWPGFAINTIFYAAILGVLFFAPGELRQTIRRRRGLCPACAYPIGASPVCTECGAAVSGTTSD